MAVSLAPQQDWHLPSSSSTSPMDQSKQPRNGAVAPNQNQPPRNGSPNARATPQSAPAEGNAHFTSPFVLPGQQQQQNWSPQGTFAYPANAFGYFPPPQAHIPFQAFDPQQQQQQSQQFAQWAAYQQLLFNAQQQQQMTAAGMMPRQRTGSAPQPPDPMAPAFVPSPNGFQLPLMPFTNNGNGSSGTSSNRTSPISEQQPNPTFHPYRRNRGPHSSPSTNSANSKSSPVIGSIAGLPLTAFPPLQAAQPPYARERNNSASSVNSSQGSSRSGHRQQTDSRQRTDSGSKKQPQNNRSQGTSSPTSNGRSPTPQGRPLDTSSRPPAVGRGSSSSNGASTPPPGHSRTRTASNSSSSSSTSPASPPSASSTAVAGSNSQNQGSVRSRIPPKPSPLSQQPSISADNASKRLSKDDSDLKGYGHTEPLTPTHGLRSAGLKGRLRRALSLNPTSTLLEEVSPNTPRPSQKSAASPITQGKKTASESTDPPTPTTPTMPHSPASSTTIPAGVSGGGEDDDGASDAVHDDSIRSTKLKKSRAGSLFNRKWNASTDNISLSSTVSSASMMIRKIGSVGALARRKSLTGITSLFKDKDKKDKSKKGGASQPDISLVTAEIERGDQGGAGISDELVGLSPAAKLARQHTLRSNAEAAARAKQQQQLQQQQQASGSKGAPGWDKDTATRQAGSPFRTRAAPGVGEDGRRAQHSRFNSEDSNDEGFINVHLPNSTSQHEGYFDEEEEDGQDDGDVTVRLGQPDADVEPWAIGVRRSLERTRRPSRGILKHAGTYSQEADLGLTRAASLSRARADSYDDILTNHQSEPGPLARIPSADPDHIDGLQSSNAPASAVDVSALLPPLNLMDISNFSDSPVSSVTNIGMSSTPGNTEKEKDRATNPLSPYAHPGMNSSAPTLSLIQSSSGNAPRSQTAPLQRRKITFAANLSVYDTFGATVYDRRSEPATCNQLTPALAQRIKEELNSYKMEEMEVHNASRAHTQFFV